MKKITIYLFLLIVITKVYGVNNSLQQTNILRNDTIKNASKEIIFYEEFMQFYGTNDTLKKLIDFYFYKREKIKTGFCMQYLYALTGITLLVCDRISDPEATAGCLILSTGMAVPCGIIVIGKYVYYSKSNLKNHIIDYNSGEPITPRLMKKLYPITN